MGDVLKSGKDRVIKPERKMNCFSDSLGMHIYWHVRLQTHRGLGHGCPGRRFRQCGQGAAHSRETLLALLEFKIRSVGKTHDASDS